MFFIFALRIGITSINQISFIHIKSERVKEVNHTNTNFASAKEKTVYKRNTKKLNILL